MFTIDLHVTKAEWLSHPAMRWNAGLEAAGLAFRQALQISQYPSAPPETSYIRTGHTASMANYNIEIFGQSMSFGSMYYLPYLLFGTSKWAGWPGKKEQITNDMTAAFKQGIVDFRK